MIKSLLSAIAFGIIAMTAIAGQAQAYHGPSYHDQLRMTKQLPDSRMAHACTYADYALMVKTGRCPAMR